MQPHERGGGHTHQFGWLIRQNYEYSQGGIPPFDSFTSRSQNMGLNPERQRALYGFVAWIATHICYALFVLWAYIPEERLRQIGVTYYPAKYWALALPCYVLVTLSAIQVLYWTYNMMHLPPLESMSTIVDEYSKQPNERDLGGATP